MKKKVLEKAIVVVGLITILMAVVYAGMVTTDYGFRFVAIWTVDQWYVYLGYASMVGLWSILYFLYKLGTLEVE